MKRTRYIRNAIYQLKRAYGFQVTLCRSVSERINFETGIEQNVTQFKIIKRAIMLPSELTTDGNVYRSATIKYKHNEREMLIDYKDIKIIGVELGDIVLFDSKSWVVSVVSNHELDTVKYVKIRHIPTSEYIDPLNPNIQNLLTVSQAVTNA